MKTKFGISYETSTEVFKCVEDLIKYREEYPVSVILAHYYITPQSTVTDKYLVDVLISIVKEEGGDYMYLEKLKVKYH